MSFINYVQKEINCKIVYYGPGLGGKTTNLQYIFNTTPGHMKGRMISLATETERTLFFDFMPLDMGEIKGFKVRLHLYTVPGQVFYNASRKLILRGVDGIIFVADSQEERFDANIEAIYNLKENLQDENYDIMDLPFVLQLNKRDLPSAMDREVLIKELNIKGEKCFDAIACQGMGVAETLKEASKQVLMHLRRAHADRGSQAF